MSLSSLGIAIVPLFVTLVLLWLANSGNRRARVGIDDFYGEAKAHEFRIKRAARVMIAFSSLLGAFFISFPAFFFPNPDLWGWVIFGGGGAAWMLAMAALSVGLARARVIVGPERVRGGYPLYRFDVPYDEVEGVERDGLGYVRIKRASGKPVVILNYFERTPDIWRLVSERARSFNRANRAESRPHAD